jgi:hypothetical protein
MQLPVERAINSDSLVASEGGASDDATDFSERPEKSTRTGDGLALDLR